MLYLLLFVQFFFVQDQLVSQNMSSGVFISTKSLVLQKVTKLDGGLYTCRAANDMGETSSQAVYLRVQCRWIVKSHIMLIFSS